MRSGAGLSLLELAAILVLVGILAMVALPRIFAAIHSGRGHADQTAALLRYAQRLPIARQGRVHVQVKGDTLSLA